MTARALYDDHGALQGLGDDDHTQYLLLAGRAGGQFAFGGTAAGNVLDLQGADASPDTGIVRVNSPVTSTYDTISNTTPAQAFVNTWAPTATVSSNYVGGYLSVGYDFTVTTAVYIPATFSDTATSRIAANPGFSAYTFINQLHIIRNSGNFNLPGGLVMNIGLTHERNTAGTSTTSGTTGVSFSPQTRTTAFGAVMTKTDQTAVRCSPTFSTVSVSTVNLGTIRGVHCFNPAVALFQPAAGVEAMTAYIGLDMNNITFGGTVTKAAVRSAQVAATNAYFLLQTSTAQSVLLGQFRFQADLTGVSFGASDDFNVGWAAGNFFFFNFAVTNPAQLRFSSEAPGSTTDRFLIQASVASAELNLNFDRFSIGDQTGAVGNSVGQFIAGTRTVSVGGEWSDFLLTQAGNITVDAAMGLVAGWTVNAPSITLGTGSVTTAAALNVGGNPGSATNRAGVRIISNPSGGAGVNAALWVTTGSSRFDGRVDINNGIALGGGAAATLGTIGGSGPTAAAQAQWLEIDIGGVAHWVAVWT